MNRKLMLFINLLLSLTMMFASCSVGSQGSKKIGNSEKDLEIFLWQAGYGREYFDSIIAAYTAKHPEVNISLTASADPSNEPIYISPETNTTDLYFTSFPTYGAVSTFDYNSDGTREPILEDLNCVLDMKAEGESKTLREKFGRNILNAVTSVEGNVYSLPWYHSLCGLVYNADMFENYGWTFPRTTDELVDLADQIRIDGKTPLIHYADYWKYLYEAWIAQYEGIEVYQDIWKGIYTDPAGEKHANDVRLITECQGRYESYSVLARLLGPKGNVYKGSNTFNHITSQTYFLDSRAAMMPNGSWVENEMKNNQSQIKYGMMKTPVISAIINKTASISDDIELCALIDAIDAGDTSLTGTGYDVTQEDYDKVEEARNLFYLDGQADVLLPAYSTAKDVAKDFLCYYFSDEAVQIAITQASMLATVSKCEGEFDYSKNSLFMQDCHNKSKNSAILIASYSERLMYAGGITQFIKNMPAKYLTYSTNKGDFLTVDQYWSMEKSAWNNSWKQILVNAGYQNA